MCSLAYTRHYLFNDFIRLLPPVSGASRIVKVAATQMSISWDLEDNMRKGEALVRDAASKGAQIILLQVPRMYKSTLKVVLVSLRSSIFDRLYSVQLSVRVDRFARGSW